MAGGSKKLEKRGEKEGGGIEGTDGKGRSDRYQMEEKIGKRERKDNMKKE